LKPPLFLSGNVLSSHIACFFFCLVIFMSAYYFFVSSIAQLYNNKMEGGKENETENWEADFSIVP
jgi:hypothetical protein